MNADKAGIFSCFFLISFLFLVLSAFIRGNQRQIFLLLFSIFLLISKYGGRHRTDSPLCRHAGGPGHRAPIAHYSSAAGRASRGHVRWRYRRRTGDTQFHLVASSRKTQERRTGLCAARRNVFALYGEYRCPRRAAGFSLCRMLYQKQSGEAAEDHLLPVIRRIEMSTQEAGEIVKIREAVQEKYGAVARRVSGTANSCCGPSSACCGSDSDPITRNLYDSAQTGVLPEEAVLASLGCGNPTALAQLAPGEVVLDLGSGGGIDVLLSARRVGPAGKAFGLDMTDDMLALARANQKKSGIGNAEFLKGEIENIPLPDNSVDVIISNCVINLSADKDRVLREAFRVLKPGGRFAVSDVVVRGEVPDEIRKHMLLWAGCIAGALRDREYTDKLAAAGFISIEIEPTRVYNIEDARAFLEQTGVDVASMAREVEGKFISAFVRAVKPV